MPTNYGNTNMFTGALGTALLIGAIIGLVAIIFSVIIWWKIFSKAGYSGAMSLLMFIPIANLVVICMLAFGEWPIYRELNQLREMARNQQYSQGRYPSPPQYPQVGQQPYRR